MVQKVLVIGSVYPRFHEDAEVPWLRTSIAHLKKAGLDIQVLAPAYKGLKSHEIDGIKVNRFRYAPANWEMLTHEEGAPSKMASKPWLQLLAIPYIISGFFKCIKICRKFKPDIIHAHWPFPHAYIALGAAKLFRIPLVLNFHGAELLLIRKKKWVKPLLKFAIGQAQAVFANSSFTASKIKALRDVTVEWSPYGTTLEGGSLPLASATASATPSSGRTALSDPSLSAHGHQGGEVSPQRPTLHEVNDKCVGRESRTSSLGHDRDQHLVLSRSDNHKFKILFVGRHIERKGIRYLIEAAKYLPRDQFEIRIVGVGDLTEELKKLASESATPNSAEIIFTGKLSPEALTNEYRTANVFTLPAIVDSKGDTEGLGVVLIEAMELGLPIVASNVGGIPDVVVNGVSGILVPEKDPEALASAYKRLAAEPELVKHLLVGSRKRIAECFTWDGIIERQIAVYNKLAK